MKTTFPVRVSEPSGQAWTAEAVNLSPFGIKVRNAPVAAPAIVRLEFHLPADGSSFTALAAALRADADGSAFAFLNLAKPDFLRIRQQVESLFLRRQVYLMVIEDDRTVAETLADYAEELGYATIIMANAEDALAYLAQDRPDAILLDLYLPGMSGLQFLEALTREGLRLPVVVISGAREPDAITSLKAGVLHYLPKPVDMEDFRRTLTMLDLTAAQQRLDTIERGFQLAF